MSKQQIAIGYAGSGVKSLKVIGVIFQGVAIISLLMAVAGLLAAFNEGDINVFIIALGTTIFSTLAGCICLVLSNIARVTLYKRHLLELEYEFVNVK